MTTADLVLVLSIDWLDERYHGEPDWPPAPARLFSALVAGAAEGASLPEAQQAGLRWLEAQPPPWIAAPRARRGQRVTSWVPNNDLDSRAIPTDTSPLRTAKVSHPHLIEDAPRIHYLWWLDAAPPPEIEQALRHCAERLHQLGRGVDMAWARLALHPRAEVEALLSRWRGPVHRPSPLGDGGPQLACPTSGTLASLLTRHAAFLSRIQTVGAGRRQSTLFQQPPKGRFLQMGYDCPPSRALFTFHPVDEPERLASLPCTAVVRWTERLRDAAIERLRAALDDALADIERALRGRSVADHPRLDPSRRVQLQVLPSVGHGHADERLRRLLVTVPGACPLDPEDVFWAFSNLEIGSHEDATSAGEGVPLVLARSHEFSMPRHLGLDTSARRWRTMTPIALPLPPPWRRPTYPTRRQREEAWTAALTQALRHAGVRVPLAAVHFRRAPFTRHGTKAGDFAGETRFDAGALVHAELCFERPVAGPLLVGNGRFLGLGQLAPVTLRRRGWTFRVLGGLSPDAHPAGVTAALRRAVLARCQQVWGQEKLPAYVHGHEEAGPTEQPHLAFQFDPDRGRLLVVPPHIRCHRDATQQERAWLRRIDEALEGFDRLRAGRAGLVELGAEEAENDPGDSVWGRHPVWRSATAYAVQRHAKRSTAEDVLKEDARRALRDAGLPEAEIRVARWRRGPGGLEGLLELRFEVAVEGPLLLGRTRHKGGGLFVATGG